MRKFYKWNNCSRNRGKKKRSYFCAVTDSWFDREKLAGSNLISQPVTNTLKLTNQYWESANLTAEQGLSRGWISTWQPGQMPWPGATGAQDAIAELIPWNQGCCSFQAHLICEQHRYWSKASSCFSQQKHKQITEMQVLILKMRGRSQLGDWSYRTRGWF